MKKNCLITLCCLLFLIPLQVSAIEYNSSAVGEGAIYSYPESGNLDQTYFYQKFHINISNISNIGYFDMKIKYDNNVVAIHSCALFNEASQTCKTNGSSNYIYYTYNNKTNKYSSSLDVYPVYTIIVKPVPNTPKSGTTNFIVEFENAEDLNGNSITIRPMNVIISFADSSKMVGGYIPNNDDSNLNAKSDNTSNNSQSQNPNSNGTVAKSSNNNLKKLEIKNYNLIFDKNVLSYTIELENKEDHLEIITELEDAKSTIKVEGNKNLSSKKNNSILIEITSENGSKKTYTIKTIAKELKEENIDDVVNGEKKDNQKIKLEKEHIIIIGIILFILFVVFIITKIKDRKIDKALDRL